MKLTKKAQYALLFTLYLCRAGRASVADAAANMRLSEPFLEQIAQVLRRGGIVKSIRGPGGGFELALEPKVGEVLIAVGEFPCVLDKEEKLSYRRSPSSEQRALFAFSGALSSAMDLVLWRNVRNIELELAANEMATLDKADHKRVN